MRRPFWLASSVLLIAAVGGFVGLRCYQANSHRLAVWEWRKKEAATRAVLERLVTLEGGPMTLGDFAALIKKESGLDVELDERSLSITRYPIQPVATIPVVVPKATLSLHSALRLTLEPKRMWADFHGRSLLITTVDNSHDRIALETVVYPLPPRGPAGMDERAWSELIDANLSDPWVPRGYTGMTTRVQPVPGALVIVHTPDGHRRVRQVIDAICRLGESKDQKSPVKIPPPPPGTMEKQILAALDHPATLELVEQPLKDVLNYLAEQHGIPLILMVDKLAEASVSPDTPITKNVQGISLRSALRLMLSDLELTYMLRDEALLITTPEDAESEEVTVVYPVHDLVKTAAGADFDSLIDVITTIVDPRTWDTASGPGPINGIGEGFLLFRQTWQVHEDVSVFLKELSRVLGTPPSAAIVTLGPSVAADQKTRDALYKYIALEFRNAKLRDVVSKLQNELNIPIVLDGKKLEEASVSPDTPVTCSLPSAPAKAQLHSLLDPLALTYVIRDEVLIITTPEDAESRLFIKLYDIRDLLTKELSGETLCDRLVKEGTPAQWARWGGPGTVSPFRGIFGVNVTEPVHEDVEKWLSEERLKAPAKTAAAENP